jgi:tetratricopeptide (TPR) repeat protein
MALFKLAEIQRRDGATDEAVKTYEKLLAINSFFSPALRRLAVLYSQRALDEPKAFEVTQKAYQAYPEDAEVVKALGILTYRREYYSRAGELLKQATAKRNDDGELFYYLGTAQQQLKQWAECKATLERALGVSLPSALVDKAKGALAECSEAAGG